MFEENKKEIDKLLA